MINSRTMFVRVYMAFLALVAGTSVGTAQPEARHVTWRYGVNLGLNYNLSGVGYANWVTSPDRPYGQFIEKVLNDGSGLGAYLGVMAEYNPSWWGLQLRVSYDNRGLTAKDNRSYKDAQGAYFSDDYVFHNSYISIEPLFRLNPFTNSGFHIKVGPGFGIKTASTFDYTPQGGAQQKDIPLAMPTGLTFSIVGGFGWDILLNDGQADRQWFLTPFLETSFMTGQRDVSFPSVQSAFDDALSTVSIRAGIGIKMGNADDANGMATPVGKMFRITPPEDGIYSKRIVDDFYPIRPFVFFDRNETKIPSRYVTISAGDTQTWGNTSGLTAEDLTNVAARSYRQGEVYYNILNIFGYRLKNSPSSTVELIGSDPVENNGDVLANVVKDYLVNTWGIDANRITTKGQLNPRIPSGTSRTPAEDKPLAEIENRRVEFVFSDPTLGRRVQLRAEREANEENLVTTELTTNENIDTWTATITGGGQRKTYGPFSEMTAYMDPTGLLASSQQSGLYTMEVVAKTTDGRTLTESEQFTLVRATSDSRMERFNLIFEYAEEDPVKRSEQFLRKDIGPLVANNSSVYVQGHTDNLGSADVNQKLSVQRAKQVREILANELSSKGKRAKFTARGFGETTDSTMFSNDLPEGRMYNRTVIIDIKPK